jgi:hypothetical protein
MHKEFIGTITGSINFTLKKEIALNPGLAGSFPWLSRIADSFQEYEIKGMIFHYVPTSGNISATSPALGAVMMQTSYRASDIAPATKSELLNEYWSSEAVPCAAFSHAIECDPKENPFQVHYIRSTGVPTGDSKLLYDYGKTFVATQGMQADGVTVGDLWVTYDIELKKPVVASNAIVGDFVYAEGGNSTLSATNSYFGPDTIQLKGSPGFYVSSNVVYIDTEIVGTFYILLQLLASAGISTTSWATAATVTNCVAGTWNVDRAMSRVTFEATAAASVKWATYGVKVVKTANNAIATITIPDVPGGPYGLTSTNIEIFGSQTV